MSIPRVLLVLAAASLGACSMELPPSNPFDPSTPLARQAPASLSGRVVLRAPSVSVVGRVIWLLDREGQRVLGTNGVPITSPIQPDDGDGLAAGLGHFELGGIAPGTYGLSSDIDSSFRPPFIAQLTLLAGETRQLEVLVWERQEIGTGRISGDVALQKAAGGPRLVSLHRVTDKGDRATGRLPKIEIVRQLRTDERGHFEATELPPGRYAVAAELSGFTPAYSAGLELDSDPGALTGEVRVPADALKLYPITAVLLPIPKIGDKYSGLYTRADLIDVAVLPFGGVKEMRLSSDPGLLDENGVEEAWTTHSQTAQVKLPAVEGAVNIYGQFRLRTEDGFEFTSELFHTTLVRDTKPPEISAITVEGSLPDAGGITWLRESGRSLKLQILGSDASSAVDGVLAYHDIANGLPPAEALVFSDVTAPAGYVRTDVDRLLTPGQGPKVVYVSLRDRAGNVSDPLPLEFIVDSVPPALDADEQVVAVNANQQRELDARQAVLRIRVPPVCRGPHPAGVPGECALDFRVGLVPLPPAGFFSPFVLGADDTVEVPVVGGNGQSVGFEVQLRDQAGNVGIHRSELYTLRLVGQLSGRVLVQGYPDEAPRHGGVVVGLYEPGQGAAPSVARAVTQPDGTFVLKTSTDDPNLASVRLPAGHYLIRGSREDLYPFEAETDVRENESAVLPAYRVAAAHGNVSGRFVRADQRASQTAHGRIEVTALRSGSVVARTLTADDGTFTFASPGLPVTVVGDTYTLFAAADGYATRKLEAIEVARSLTTLVDSDGGSPPSPRAQELARMSGDFAFCDALTGECVATLVTNLTSARVKLLDATGVTEIRLAARTAFAADATTPAWRAFDPAGLYTTELAAAPLDAEGAIPVYVQTKVSGAVRPVMSATIVYDRTPPSITAFDTFPGPNAREGFTNQPTVRTRVVADAGTGRVAPLQAAWVVFAPVAPAAVPASATPCLFDASCAVPLPSTAGVIAEQIHTAWAFACDQARNCSTSAASAKIVYDRTAPKSANGVTFQPAGAWATQADGHWYTRTSRVDVALGIGTARNANGVAVLDRDGAAVAEVAQYRFSLRPALSDAAWVAAAPSVGVGASDSVSGPALTGDDGPYRIYAQFMDAAGNATDVETGPRTFDITLDRLPPAVSLELNGGAPWTTYPNVQLEVISAAGDLGPAREVLLTVDGGLFNTFDRRALPLADATYTLPAADGFHVLYARFIDAAGNVSDRSASIWIDRSKPKILSLTCGTCRTDPVTGTLYSNATTRQALLDLVAVDNSGQIALLKTKVGTGGVASSQYVSSLTVTFPDLDGAHTVSVSALDPAGNESASQTISIVLDRLAPDAALRVDGGAATTTSAAVVVSIDNRDGKPLSGVRLSNSGTFAGPVQPAATSLAWTLDAPALDGPRTVYAELTDPAGNVSTLSDGIVLDSHAPTTPVLALTQPASPGPGNAVAAPAIALAITSTDVAASLSNATVLLEGDLAAAGGSTGWLAAGAGGLTFAGGTFAWAGSLSEGDGPKSVSVRVRDLAGNTSEAALVHLQLQTKAPANGSASLAPAPFTGTTTGALTLAATGATFVKIAGLDLASVGGLPANVGVFMPFSSAVPVVLTTGDGPKNLSVTFRNDAGLTSTPIALSTTLDTLPPTGALTLTGPVDLAGTSTVRSGSRTVLLGIVASDAGSGTTEMRVADTVAGLAAAAWQRVQTTLAWTLPSAEGLNTVHLQLRDLLGKTSGDLTASTTLDLTPPTGPRFAAQPPATKQTSVTVSLGTEAIDVLSGPVRYEWLAPGAANWATVTFPTTATLPANQASSFKVRAVDLAGNVSPEDAFTLVHDDVAPPVPLIATPRRYVNATTTSVSLSGSDTDASFARYETCTTVVGAAASCAPSCAFAPSSSGFALSLTAGQKTCLFAQSVDRAGNASSTKATAWVVSDLTAPLPPQLLPSADPSQVQARADWVDFFLSAPASDLPLGGIAAPYRGVAWLELDAGSGFSPLCAQSLADDTWSPCKAATLCTDPRVVCSGETLSALRVPLTRGLANAIVVRAVDLAGNIGDGVSQVVNVPGAVPVDGPAGNGPSMAGTTLTYQKAAYDGFARVLVRELGVDRRPDPSDVSCEVLGIGAAGTAGLVYTPDRRAIYLRRRGADGVLCTADDAPPVAPELLRDLSTDNLFMNSTLSLSGERAAWVETNYVAPGGARVVVVEGPTGTLGASPTVTVLGSYIGTDYGSWAAVRGSTVLASTYVGAGDPVWRVFTARTGGFAAGFDSWIFSADSAALWADGSQLLTYAAGALTLRAPGADGKYGTSDDVVANRAFPSSAASIALAGEGTHAVAIEAVGSIGRWDTGGDGVFGTSDDTFVKQLTGTVSRSSPSIGAGVLAYQVGSASILTTDLTTMRWVWLPPPGAAGPVNDEGTIVAGASNQKLLAHAVSGIETTGSASYQNPLFALDSSNVIVASENAPLTQHRPGADGVYFTTDDPAPATFGDPFQRYAGASLGAGGRLITYRYTGTSPNRMLEPRMFEPTSGSLSGAPEISLAGGECTSVIESFHQVLLGGASNRHAVFLARKAIVPAENPRTVYVCIRRSGKDGLFTTTDNGLPVLLRDRSGVAYVVTPSSYARAYANDRVAFLSSPITLTIVDAGTDHLFNTADDRPVVLQPPVQAITMYALDDRALSFVGAPSGGGGLQVYRYDIATGTLTQVTSHFSDKTHLFVAPSGGRMIWSDSVLPQAAIFEFQP